MILFGTLQKKAIYEDALFLKNADLVGKNYFYQIILIVFSINADEYN